MFYPRFTLFQLLIRQEGVRGLYRGLAANLTGVIPEKAIKLAVNDAARDWFARRENCHPAQLPNHLGMVSRVICQLHRHRVPLRGFVR